MDFKNNPAQLLHSINRIQPSFIKILFHRFWFYYLKEVMQDLCAFRITWKEKWPAGSPCKL